MKIRWKYCEISKLINIIISIALISGVLIGREIFNSEFYILSLLYSLFSLLFVLLPQNRVNNLAVYIIRITGFARYIFTIYLMKVDRIYLLDSSTVILMIVEIVVVYFAILVYSIKKHKINCELSIKKNGDKVERKKLKLGISVISILAIGVVIIIRYKVFLEQYFILTRNKNPLPLNGGINILVTIFFVIVLIKSLEVIKKAKQISDIVKIILSLVISVFFINGCSITATNVSRWTMVITTLISCQYILKLYPNYRNKIISIIVPVIIITIVVGTVLKLNTNSNTNNNFSVQNTIEKQIKYKIMNAYFSGPNNVSEALELQDTIASKNISKVEILISDVFANFPMLNKLTDTSVNTHTLFNYQHYKSDIAKDQIIPLVGQTYLIFDIFFPIIIFIIIYLSLYYAEKIRYENNFLNLYCYIYIAFWLSLGNCLNFTIMLQSVWINILPVYIVYILNYNLSSNGRRILC